MNIEQQSSSVISLEDIINFPFPYKLWLAVNSETCEFAKWNIDGTELELKYVSLDRYLSSSKSFFKMKNRSSFINHLHVYGFTIIKSKWTEQGSNMNEFRSVDSMFSELEMNFKHEYFLRHRIDLLAWIRATKTEELTSVESTGNLRSVPAHMQDDLCFMSFGPISEIQKAHIKHHTILNYQIESKILKEKLVASELKSVVNSQLGDEDNATIELPSDLFENPYDSVLHMADEQPRPYAGFYGNASQEEISRFFGDFLPMYEQDNMGTDEKKSAELNPDLNATVEDPSLQPTDLEMSLPSEAEDTIQTRNVIQAEVKLAQPLSSSLEPILIPDYYNHDEDISMEEFIKFKEQPLNNELITTTGLPTIKIEPLEEKDDYENEANFKNFFSQYRESLGLLYESQ